MAKAVEQLESVTIRFAGDSGDGMQLTGSRFTSETAVLGNDLSTLPDFPAEIRAPAGSLPGVSGFQIHFADHDILTPGDRPDVLVAMNPAALKTNVRELAQSATGMPTKPKQADLLMVMFGRNSESPVPVLAASTPGNCFDMALEAIRISLKYRTPVYLLSDAYLANGAEPWLIPDAAALPDLSIEFATEPNADGGTFLPYLRDPQTLARPWAIPGTPGLEHRIGGLEKEDVT